MSMSIFDKRPELPAAITSAITLGDLARVKDLYQPTMTLEEIATQAAKNTQPQILQWCCDQGWRPPRESFNNAFFSQATYGASPAIFQILIDHGSDLNVQENELHGDALCCAIVSEEYKFAKWLLEHGHRPTPREGIYGPTAISWTINGWSPSLEMLELLLDYGHDLEQYGPGVIAADDGNIEALRLLLDRGVNIEDVYMDSQLFGLEGDEDEQYRSQGTALYRACRQGHVDCVELLLSRGADPLAKDLDGISCLEITKRLGHEDVVRLLEDHEKITPGRIRVGLLQWLFSFW
ncbi:ankyrin [Decorospora gaudefroyi]|uniref:Ankyrin n=1 Tax=Decorospora gaudefroyi TaxID=184978 RepID=A0A6A5K9C0_9PLEO|nr:ankyrin [Decorospora gaudefroyi]